MMLIDYFLTGNNFMCTDGVSTLCRFMPNPNYHDFPPCLPLLIFHFPQTGPVCLFVSPMPGHTAGHSGLCVTTSVMNSHKHEMNTT